MTASRTHSCEKTFLQVRYAHRKSEKGHNNDNTLKIFNYISMCIPIKTQPGISITFDTFDL